MNSTNLSEFSSQPDDDRCRLRWAVYLLVITMFVGASAASLYNVRPLLSANDRSRWCTVWSLVERGTYRIDEIITRPGWDTIDKVRHEEHYYSSKPALLPTLVAGLYWTVKQVTGWTLLEKTAETTRLILVFVNLLPMVLFLIVTARLVERTARTDFARIFVVTTAAFGTLLSPFLMTLNNHTLAAMSVLLAIYPAYRILVEDVKCPLCFGLAGFFAAFACTNELPAALFSVAIFGLLVFRAPKRTLLFFVPAALIPLAAFFVTTYLATGGWKPFYLYYGTDKYNYIVDGIPSYWMQPKGIDNNHESPLRYLLHCTIGHHGILSLSPVFLISLLGWAKIRRAKQFPAQVFLWMGLGLTVAILGFYLTRTANYNYGGISAGLRWTFWLIPFWMIALVPTLDAWADRRGLRFLAAGLLGVSVFSAVAPLSNPWQQPWLYTWMEKQGWINYRDPYPVFEQPPTTWFPALPHSVDPQHPDWIELSGLAGDGTSLRMRLVDGGVQTVAEKAWHRIQIIRTSDSGEMMTATFAIDEEAFAAGKQAGDFLRPLEESSDGLAQKKRQRSLAFLRGLPRPAIFARRHDRYLRTRLRNDAFLCRRATASVRFRPEGEKRELGFRCDVWLSAEVPFGVVRIDTLVYDPVARTVITRRSLTASAVSRLLP